MSEPLHSAAASPWPVVASAAALVALGSLVFGFHLGAYGLWEPDEARYAEIAREMLATRGFLIPHLNYVLYVEKPPLLYWLTALWMGVAGTNEFAARTVCTTAALIGVIATWVFTLRAFDRRRALLAGAILTTMPLYAVMAQVLTTDMLLTMVITVALWALFLHWRERARWCWVAYVAMGLGVLTKGPVAVAIPLLTGIVFLWWERDLKNAFKRFHVIAGLSLTLVIAAPWFIYATIKVPGYFPFYFIGENLLRFVKPGYSHGEPIYFYLPVLAAGMIPWSAIAPFLIWRPMGPNPARRFCVVAASVVFIFFSLASAKLIPYVMPVLPPIAVLIADATLGSVEPRAEGAAGGPREPRRLAVIGPILGLLGAVAIATAGFAHDFRTPYLPMVAPTLYALGTVATIGGILTASAFWLRRTGAGLTILIMVLAAALAAATYGRIAAEPLRSYAALSKEVTARAPDATLVCYRRYVQSLPFYTRKRVIVVGARTELGFGAARAADADQYFFSGDEALLKLWRMARPTVIVIDAGDLERLKGRLGEFIVIGSEGKKRAIFKGSAPVRAD